MKMVRKSSCTMPRAYRSYAKMLLLRGVCMMFGCVCALPTPLFLHAHLTSPPHPPRRVFVRVCMPSAHSPSHPLPCPPPTPPSPPPALCDICPSTGGPHLGSSQHRGDDARKASLRYEDSMHTHDHRYLVIKSESDSMLCCRTPSFPTLHPKL